MTKRKLHIAYSNDYMKWQLGEGHPTNPVRAQIARRLLMKVVPLDEIQWAVPRQPVEAVDEKRWADLYDDLCLVHDPGYVQGVLEGHCGEWSGRQPVLGAVASLMFQGTRMLVHRMLATPENERGVYFNPQGAKHHAQHDKASGFCVFNDMAWAAQYMTARGMRVAYLDWDAHHGDGVENLLRWNQDAATYSIHQSGIFPGTGLDHDFERAVYNFPLPAYAGDDGLLSRVKEALDDMYTKNPDVLLLACGADGLEGDPLSRLGYTQEGITRAATMVGEFCRNLDIPIVIGGAGGYRPHDATPQAWATTVAVIHRLVAG